MRDSLEIYSGSDHQERILKHFQKLCKITLVMTYGVSNWTKKPGSAKVLKGFGGSDVLELVDNHDSDTYIVVYTIRFASAVP